MSLYSALKCRQYLRCLGLVFSLACLFSCSFAPKNPLPKVEIPAAYKEASSIESKFKWLAVRQKTTELRPGPWWEMYHDPVLNKLEKQVSCKNLDIRIAMARYDESMADLNAARSAYFPKILGVGNMYRQQLSLNTVSSSRLLQAANNGAIGNLALYNDNLLIANLYYEVDVWGRVRNSVAEARSLVQANAAEVSVIALTMRAQLASNYFTIRGYDAEQRVLNETVKAYQKSFELTKRRFKGGVVSVADLDQAEAQLNTTKTAAADMQLRRAQLEHAIATLIGKPPALFRLKPKHYHSHWVTISPDLPSTLLQRRPDIAEAAQRVQAANANIGVARSAYFPVFNLAIGAGLESSLLANLFTKKSSVWALGSTTATALLNSGNMPLITQTLFDGGKIKALNERAYAEYNETVASYRKMVLTAYQEVENSLVAIRQLDKEYQTQLLATRAAKRAQRQAVYRYKEGLTNYQGVVMAETIALQAQLALININIRRQSASVSLIKALGGGWHCPKNCCVTKCIAVTNAKGVSPHDY